MNTGETIALIKAFGKGGGGSSLPPVTSSDNGSELIVKNGAWTKQKKKFIVTLTPTALDYSGTMDKTVAEINAAYEAGQEIWFKVMTGATTYSMCPITQVGKGADDYPSYNAYIIDTDNSAFILAYTGTTNDGTKNTYNTIIYALTPAS